MTSSLESVARDRWVLPADPQPNPVLLTAAEKGRRNRRTIDAVLLVPAALVTGFTAVVATSDPQTDDDVRRALDTMLGWAGGLLRSAFLGALLLALAIAADVVVRRRWALARDLLVAVLLVGAVGSVLGRLVESDWFVIEGDIWSRWGFPELRVAFVAAVVAVTAPELARPVRVFAAWLVALAALGAVVLDAALPSGALGGLALGIGGAALVRFAFGTAAGVPPADQVRVALAALGVDVRDMAVAARQRIGAAEYVGHDRSGRPLKARVLGRDAQDTQKLVRRWRLLVYRDPPRSVAVGRLEQVEHEALATLLAAQAGVRVPGVVTAALGPRGDALMVTLEPDVETLEDSAPDGVQDETLRDLWSQVARLHAAGISHGRLNASNVALVEGAPVLLDLSAATLGAPHSALDIDVAELLVACTVLVGHDRALRTAIDGIGTDAVTGAMPYVQRAALTPHGRDLARAHEVELDDLRAAAGRATGAEVPEIAPMRRVRAQDLVMLALVMGAAYVLVTQLADIGIDTFVDEVGRADPGWLVVALILAQVTFLGGAISVRGAVPTPLPLLPCVVLQAALRFINLTVPSSAGRIAMNLRFLQRMGASTAEAVASGAIDDMSENVVKVLLLLFAAPYVGSELDTSRFHVGAPAPGVIVAVVAALAVGVAVMLGVAAVRAKVLPHLRRGLATLTSVVRNPRKRLELFGGNLLSALLFAFVLGAACRAYGVELSLAELIFINTVAGIIAGLVPVPGGIGAAEATLAAGLVAVGVDESSAFAIALTRRLCTFYLPPIWGYPSLRWLRRRAYL
jgi:uncharacterized membrane protein YbhN (UPF0104 family)/tRNA A-37 threonylcarbamoyl transferase component Bud32